MTRSVGSEGVYVDRFEFFVFLYQCVSVGFWKDITSRVLEKKRVNQSSFGKKNGPLQWSYVSGVVMVGSDGSGLMWEPTVFVCEDRGVSVEDRKWDDLGWEWGVDMWAKLLNTFMSLNVVK